MVSLPNISIWDSSLQIPTTWNITSDSQICWWWVSQSACAGLLGDFCVLQNMRKKTMLRHSQSIPFRVYEKVFKKIWQTGQWYANGSYTYLGEDSFTYTSTKPPMSEPSSLNLLQISPLWKHMQPVIFCTIFWEELELKKCKRHSSYPTKPVFSCLCITDFVHNFCYIFSLLELIAGGSLAKKYHSSFEIIILQW